MKKTKDLLKKIPFISLENYLLISKVPQYTFEKWLAEELVSYNLCPLELLEKLVLGVQLTHDLTLEAIENPEATLKIQKYLTYHRLSPILESNTLEKYLEILDEMEQHLEGRVNSGKYGVPAPKAEQISAVALLEAEDMEALLHAGDLGLKPSHSQKLPSYSQKLISPNTKIEEFNLNKPQTWPITNELNIIKDELSVIKEKPKTQNLIDRVAKFLSGEK